MPSTPARPEPFFVRYAWVVLFSLSVIFGLFALGDVSQGLNADTAVPQSFTGVPWPEFQAAYPTHVNLLNVVVRAGGVNLIVIALLSAVVCLTGFRRGERWAWYTLWVWPLWMAGIFIVFLTAPRLPAAPAPPPLQSAPVFLTLSVLALALSYRKFFQKEPAQ